MVTDKQRTPFPVIAGILIIISEGMKLLGLFIAFIASLFLSSFFLPFLVVPFVLLPLLALSVLAFFGGVSALQRKRWGLALAGSIISFLPFSPLGLVALILVALSRNEFD